MGTPARAVARPVARRPPLFNRFMTRLLASRARRLAGHTVLLRYTAAAGGPVVLPARAARTTGGLVIMAGNAATKRWWRHFRTASPVEVLLDGGWYAGRGRVVAGAQSPAAAAYRRAFPRTPVPADAIMVAVDLTDGAPPPDARGRGLLGAWLRTVTAAEFVGFAVPATVGALTADAPVAAAVPALLAAGAVEGGMLGWGQAVVLRRARPELPQRRWIIATSAAATFAYAVGLVPSTIAGAVGSWPPVVLAVGAVVLGAALLASIGTAQWWILRHQVTGAASWIGTTAVAWLVGLAVFGGFTMPLWQPGQPLALVVLIGVVGGLLMAATTSAITGVALRRLLRRSEPHPSGTHAR